jgi:hypothetical protein
MRVGEELRAWALAPAPTRKSTDSISMKPASGCSGGHSQDQPRSVQVQAAHGWIAGQTGSGSPVLVSPELAVVGSSAVVSVVVVVVVVVRAGGGRGVAGRAGDGGGALAGVGGEGDVVAAASEQEQERQRGSHRDSVA